MQTAWERIRQRYTTMKFNLIELDQTFKCLYIQFIWCRVPEGSPSPVFTHVVLRVGQSWVLVWPTVAFRFEKWCDLHLLTLVIVSSSLLVASEVEWLAGYSIYRWWSMVFLSVKKKSHRSASANTNLSCWRKKRYIPPVWNSANLFYYSFIGLQIAKWSHSRLVVWNGSLWSSSSCLLVVPRVPSKTRTEVTFSHCDPSLSELEDLKRAECVDIFTNLKHTFPAGLLASVCVYFPLHYYIILYLIHLKMLIILIRSF